MTKKARKSASSSPVVGIAMGSQSDWETMEHTANTLKSFGVPFEAVVVSAHRTPERMVSYAMSAAGRGIKIIVAGAGGAAHLPGMLASLTTLPVFGVPVRSKSLDGLDSLLSIAQMPAGVPVGTLAIGEAGAKNAALLAISVLALADKGLAQKWRVFRAAQTASVVKTPTKSSLKKLRKAK